MTTPKSIPALEAFGIQMKWITPQRDKYHVCKSPRRRGLVVAYIRWLLKKRKRITAHSISPPLVLDNANAILSRMCQLKELKRVRNGKRGPNHRPAVFAVNNSTK